MEQLLIRDAVAFGRSGRVDILIEGGKITKTGSGLSTTGRTIEAGGRFVSPAFADPHAHLDKSLIYDRQRSGERGSLSDMIKATREIKKSMTIEDVKERALRVIDSSLRDGITTIRTNVEADPFVEMRAVEGILQAKEESRGRVDLQTVAFAQEGWFDTPGSLESGSEPYLEEALKAGIDVIGGNVNRAVWPSEPEKQVDRMFDLASEFNCDVDMHLDNADSAEAFTLPYVIDKTREYGYQGRVSAGHVVGIVHVDEASRRRALQGAAEAQISIVVLPTRMKLTCVRDFFEAGANVTIGTDNYRDVFVYFANTNMLERMLLLSRIIGVQSDEELTEVYKMGTTYAARSMGMEGYGLEEGNAADIIIFDSNSMVETVMQLARPIYVIKNGIVVIDGSVKNLV